MIKVNRNNNIITISGHANSADYGKDIVCAAVSSICYTTINAIAKIRKSAIEVKDDDIMKITVLDADEVVNALIENMFELLNKLANDYPNNIKVKES